MIKVERPGSSDDSRAFLPFLPGESAYFAGLDHGKWSIAPDLKDAADRAVFDRLLARADVLLENFRPGAMGRLGHGWAALSTRHPRLIHGAVSGFGQTGPEAGKPACDMVVQARAMVLPVTPQPGRPGFTAAGNPIRMPTLAEIDQRPPAPRLVSGRCGTDPLPDQPHPAPGGIE